MKKRKFYTLSNDVVFKGFFGSEKRRDLLVQLITHYIDIDIDPQSIEILSPDLTPTKAEDKMPRLDLRVKTHLGEYVHIEVQAWNKGHLIERVHYYHTKLFAEQMVKGGRYQDLSRVISLTFVYYDLDVFKENTQYINAIMYCNQENRELLPELGYMCYVELNKFRRYYQQDVLKEDDLWTEILAAQTEKAVDDLESRGGIMATVAKELKYFNQDEIERFLPEMLEKAENDYLHDTGYAQEKGMELGLEKGLKQGLKQGLEQGLEQGLKQGLEQGALINAKNLHALGVDKETILKAIDITEDEFNQLIK